MHGEQETTPVPRATCAAIHAGLLAVAGWIYFGGGARLVFGLCGMESVEPGNLARRTMLFTFGVLLFVRLMLTFFVLLKRCSAPVTRPGSCSHSSRR